MTEEKFCVPPHCLYAVDYLEVNFAIWTSLKEIS